MQRKKMVMLQAGEEIWKGNLEKIITFNLDFRFILFFNIENYNADLGNYINYASSARFRRVVSH